MSQILIIFLLTGNFPTVDRAVNELLKANKKKLCTKVDLVFIKGTSFREPIALQCNGMEMNWNSIAPDEVQNVDEVTKCGNEVMK